MSEDGRILFDAVSFGYGQVRVLDQASFSIPLSQASCIVGPNGCGKTTLCRLIMGVLKPNSGRIQILDTTPQKARSRVGYMPQQMAFDNMFPASVLDVVLTGRLRSGCLFGYSREDREAAERALDWLGLAALRNRPFGTLSGGQRRRVLVARALACEPELLVMDEPTANVDPAAEHALLETLERLDRRVRVLLVSHQFDFVSRYVEQVICMHEGGHVHVHPTAEVTPDELERLYRGKMRLVRHDMDLNPPCHD